MVGNAVQDKPLQKRESVGTKTGDQSKHQMHYSLHVSGTKIQ